MKVVISKKKKNDQRYNGKYLKNGTFDAKFELCRTYLKKLLFEKTDNWQQRHKQMRSTFYTSNKTSLQNNVLRILTGKKHHKIKLQHL